jgi:hypothetical protein
VHSLLSKHHQQLPCSRCVLVLTACCVYCFLLSSAVLCVLCAVSRFLFSRRELNLTKLAGVTLNPTYMRMNVIHGMWYDMPSKADVLRHLDQGGQRPPRRARVVLIMNAVTPPVVREVLVPLPSANNYTFAPIHGLPDGRTSLPMLYRPQGPMDSIG